MANNTLKKLSISKPYRYWLAALIDGEGWVGCVQNRGGKAVVYSYGVIIGMTHRRMIQKIRQVTGIGKIDLSHPKGNRKPVWFWRVTRRDEIRQLLNTIVDLLIVKQKQARLLLSCPPEANTAIPVRRQRIYSALRTLNHRGR